MSFLLMLIRHKTKILVLTLLCAQAMTPAIALEGRQQVRHWTPVSDAVLSEMRGGFQSNANGPMMSFGIERSVFLNGQLINSTVLNIPDLLQLTSNPTNTFTLIQTGGGNAVTSSMSSLPAL